MPSIPFQKRPYDAFVSYAHSDATLVVRLVTWLRDSAGLSVWLDQKALTAGSQLSSALPTGLARARAGIFCISKAWNESSWCEDEFGVALQERRADRQYRLIGLHLDDSPVPPFLKNVSYIECKDFDTDVARQLLEALAIGPASWLHSDSDLYISRSWHPDETADADLITGIIGPLGYRLIGDSPEYGKFDAATRLRRIIATCGALIAILPYRDDKANGCTSKWIIEEIRIAISLGVPYVIFAAEGVTIDSSLVESAIGARTFKCPKTPDDPVMKDAVLSLEEAYNHNKQPALVFFAASIRNAPEDVSRLTALVGYITNMECVLGQRLRGQLAQQEIIKRIKQAQFVIADITSNHLNTLIEAGIARGAGVDLHLICETPASGDLKTRFMFSDLEVNWYRSEVERMGVIHRVARQYRRRVYE